MSCKNMVLVFVADHLVFHTIVINCPYLNVAPLPLDRLFAHDHQRDCDPSLLSNGDHGAQHNPITQKRSNDEKPSPPGL